MMVVVPSHVQCKWIIKIENFSFVFKSCLANLLIMIIDQQHHRHLFHGLITWPYDHPDHQVYVAMLIILLLAGAITGLKMYLVQQFGPTPDPK